MLRFGVRAGQHSLAVVQRGCASCAALKDTPSDNAGSALSSEFGVRAGARSLASYADAGSPLSSENRKFLVPVRLSIHMIFI